MNVKLKNKPYFLFGLLIYGPGVQIPYCPPITFLAVKFEIIID